MNLKLAPLFISLALALLSGNALADHVIKNLTKKFVPNVVHNASNKLLVAMSTTALHPVKENHNWNGLYVGAFVGGASGTNVNTTTPYDHKTGVHHGVAGSQNYNTRVSPIGGGTIGYNFRIGETPYIAGLEAEVGHFRSKGKNNDIQSLSDGDSPASYHKTKMGGSFGYAMLGGRVGYAHKKTLFFIKGGAVFTKQQSGYTDTSASGGGAGSPIQGWLNTSSSKTRVGYGIGCGIEQALPENWFKHAKHFSIKLEYLYLGVGNSRTSRGHDPEDLASLGTTRDTTSGVHTAKSVSYTHLTLPTTPYV